MSMNYVELKVSELREECKLRNLDTSGLKVHLVDRLNTYDKNQLLKSRSENKTVSKNFEQNKADGSGEDTVSAMQDKSDSTVNSDSISENGSGNSINVEEKAIEKVQNKEDRKRPYESNPLNTKDNSYKLVAEESLNWESRTDVHLDFYNSDMNLIISDNGYSGNPLHEDGFQYVCAGVKGNYGVKSGKVYFEVKIIKKIKIELNSDAGESNFIRIGWSVNNELLTLGEFGLSFGYDSVGKKLNDGNSSDYGVKVDEGDVVGCFLEFNGDSFIIRYTVNGEDQGEAFTVLSRELKDHVLMPHIYVRNISFEVNFGQNEKEPLFPPKTVIEGSEPIEDVTWTLLGKVNLNQRTRAIRPPKVKTECEVLMMCGLPSCGKTTWTEKQIKEHPDKRYNLLSINTVLEKMKVNNLRKKVSASRWDSFILSATQCLNKLMEMAVSRRRNFILDQTNCYPTAQRRRMKPFEEFIRKAIIVVPTDDEYQRRMNQVIQEEGKDVPESAVLQMKENFVIPEENSDLFNEIIFIELARGEAEELIKKYNEEAKMQKKKDSNSDSKSKREADDDSYGKWNSTSKSSEDSEPTAPKKSRWNDQSENRKESKGRGDKYERASPERSLPRKNDYKGGFCFSREASDSSKGGGNRSNDGGFRSDNRHADKSKDQRVDRSGGNRSNNGAYRKSVDSNDRKPRFDRDESRFGNRNPVQGNRDSRPRDRGNNEPRGGGNQFQGRDRSRGGGGFGDRRQQHNSGSYEDTESRTRFPTANYNDRSGGGIGVPKFSNNQERGRFPPGGNNNNNNMPGERTEFRGRGRGASSGGNPSMNIGGRDSYVDRRNIPESRTEFPNYSDFNSYSAVDNRQQQQSNNNPPSWQQHNYNEESGLLDRRGGGGGGAVYGDRASHQAAGNYEQQYGGSVGMGMRNNAMQGGGSGARGKQPSDKLSNPPYGDRKPSINPRGGGHANARGARTGAPQQMDSGYSNDDYSYGSGKNYEQQPQSMSKFGNKPMYGGDQSSSQYKEAPRQDSPYGNTKPIRGGGGGYSKFGGDAAQKPYHHQAHHQQSGGDMKIDNSGRGDYSSNMPPQSNSAPYENYQSYDNLSSQFNQNQGYYNYYTGGDSDKDQSAAVGGGAGSSYPSTAAAAAAITNRAPYQYQSTGGSNQSNYTAPPNPPPAAAVGYQSSYSNPTSGTGYQTAGSNYSSGGAGGYQSNYPTGGGGSGGYQSNYPSNPSSAAAAAPYQSAYQSSLSSASNSTSGTAATAGTAAAAAGYTNPYSAMYENASSGYNTTGYYGGQATNTFAQSGSYGGSAAGTGAAAGGDNTNSKFSDYNTKPAAIMDRSMPPPPVATTMASQPASNQNQATWGTGYGDYSQYYGQYYGQN